MFNVFGREWRGGEAERRVRSGRQGGGAAQSDRESVARLTNRERAGKSGTERKHGTADEQSGRLASRAQRDREREYEYEYGQPTEREREYEYDQPAAGRGDKRAPTNQQN